jgi:hypothetical protein
VCSAQRAVEFLGKPVPELELKLIDLFIGQIPVHMTVVDAETQALLASLGMYKFIN